MDRDEVVAAREALSYADLERRRGRDAARRARRKAQFANYYRARCGLPALPLPPGPQDDDDTEDHHDVILEAEAVARIAEVARVKRGLRRLGIRPRLTPEELARVLPE